MIKLTIDDKIVEVQDGSSILDAARMTGITIPTLCHLELKDMCIENKPAGCRVCVVEVDGRRNLAPACATSVSEGMVVHTHSIRVLNARRVVMELILSDHPADCLVCAKNGNCDLQSMAQRFEVSEIRYQGAQSHYREDFSPSIIREMDKCIMCRRCETMCNTIQTVGALSGINRGFEAVVAPAFEEDLEKTVCTYCGQCVAVCPTGALTEVNHANRIVAALAHPKKTVIVQVAPAVRAALGELFDMEPGTLVTGKMVAALRSLGFDYVFDTDFAADLTIMEEGTELLERLARHLAGEKVNLPILTSCCPAWVNFLEKQFPEFKNIPSTARSPQQMFGAVAKTYFAEKIGVKRDDLIVVSIMPCLAKKYECQRDEFKTNDNPDVDFALTTREFGGLIKRANIDFAGLQDEDFDHPMGESTGAGVIFGVTGGVIEAAVRTAYEVYTKKTLEKVDFEELRGMEGIRHAKVDFNGLEINIGIAHGLGHARELLESIRRGECNFHAIEIMSCPGGCIGGGGQPWHHGKQEVLTSRAKAIYSEDAQKVIRKSHENPYIIKLYKEFLGKPMSEKAHRLLHTNYYDRKVKFEEEQ